MKRSRLVPAVVAVLALALPAWSQVVETGSGDGFLQFALPGTPVGSGIDFVFVDNPTSISFTPGAVTFMGQPVDFSGTEAAWLASSHTGRWCVPVNSGPTVTDATGSGNHVGAVLTAPAGRKISGLALGPGFSAADIDVVVGTSILDREHIPEWNSVLVPELNGQSVEIDVDRNFTNSAGGIISYTMTLAITVVPSVWTDLGNALAGTNGDPLLVGQGTLIACNPMALELSNALGNSSTVLVFGLAPLFAPFKGGVMVPTPDNLIFGLPTDPTGSLTLATIWPKGIPPGVTFFFQHWIDDAAGPQGYSASNGLSGTTP